MSQLAGHQYVCEAGIPGYGKHLTHVLDGAGDMSTDSEPTHTDGSCAPEGRHEDVRIVLRPYASPMSLGFLALCGSAVMLSGLQLGWFSLTETPIISVVLVLFAFPLQLLASIFGFLCRDMVAATGMGILAGSWLATGTTKILLLPGAASPVLGAFLIIVGAVLLVPATVATLDKGVPALVLFAAAAKFVLSGIFQTTASIPVGTAAGAVGLVAAVIAFYAALALGLEDARRSTVLPVLRRHEAQRGTRAGVEDEAGIRGQL
jgi:uncharacterized protein